MNGDSDPPNIFAEVVTPEVVRDILAAQVSKARRGDTGAANLVLKIAMAANGKDQSARRNVDSGSGKPVTVKAPLLIACLKSGPATAGQLAARLGADEDAVLLVLERDVRFYRSDRGAWSFDSQVKKGIE